MRLNITTQSRLLQESDGLTLIEMLFTLTLLSFAATTFLHGAIILLRAYHHTHVTTDSVNFVSQARALIALHLQTSSPTEDSSEFTLSDPSLAAPIRVSCHDVIHHEPENLPPHDIIVECRTQNTSQVEQHPSFKLERILLWKTAILH